MQDAQSITARYYICKKCKQVCSVYLSRSRYFGGTLLSKCCRYQASLSRVQAIPFPLETDSPSAIGSEPVPTPDSSES